MTDNLPAVPEETPQEIATSDVDSWIAVASDVIKLANLIAPTEFVPKSLRDSAPATAAAILYGREVGLPPMSALTQIFVINGRPAMYAEAQRALVLAAGHEIEIVESTRARCEIRGRRRGREKWQTVTWTIDEVRHLAGKDTWREYPRQMLQARASAELCRLVFPDVLHGFRAVEETDDLPVEELTPEPTKVTPRKTTTPRKRAPRKTTPPPLEARPTLTQGPPLPGDPDYPQTSAGDPSHTHRESTDTEPGSSPGESPADPKDVPIVSSVGPHDRDSEGTAGGSSLGDAPAGTAEPERGPRAATRAQHRMIHALLDEIHGHKIEDQDRYDIASAIVARPIGSFNDLTHSNATTLIDVLGLVQTSEELATLIRERTKGDTP